MKLYQWECDELSIDEPREPWALADSKGEALGLIREALESPRSDYYIRAPEARDPYMENLRENEPVVIEGPKLIFFDEF